MRPTRFAFAVPFLLPLVGIASVRADDAPKPAPAAPPVVPDAPAKPAPDAAKPDAAKPDVAKPDASKKEEPKASAIAWVHDYDEAKAKAAEQKKGLFVYLTPSWFT
jgi:hypothetical protein